jgi:hypothetical protein
MTSQITYNWVQIGSKGILKQNDMHFLTIYWRIAEISKHINEIKFFYEAIHYVPKLGLNYIWCVL